MNSNNIPATLRSFIVYAACVPLAIFVGYLLAASWDTSTFGIAVGLTLILATPILLRWHHFLLIVSWNLAMTVFFLPGHPLVWMPMVLLSLGISIVQRALNGEARFISAPLITWPLIFLAVIVLFTAEMTGGIGMRSLHSEVMGGRDYFMLLGAILGYFALSAKRIPPQLAKVYVALFFLSGLTNFIGDMAPYVPSFLYPIFLFFPPRGSYDIESDISALDFNARFYGISVAGMAGFLFMLARYGVRGIFNSGKLWRLFLFAAFFVLIFFGGFRSFIILIAMTFFFQFFLEGAHHTKLLPAFIFIGIIGAAIIIPFSNKLPYTFQRSLAFLPLKIRADVRADAEGSEQWRLDLWKSVLPQVPEYLWLGKGYAITAAEFEAMGRDTAFKAFDPSQQGLALAGDYHSGPLSTIIPFGIWGVIGLLWFWAAMGRGLYNNYRYGDAELKTVNIFLLAYFIAKVILYIVVFGGFYSDMWGFIGIIGLSVSLNGGIRRRVVAPEDAAAEIPVPAPAYPRLRPVFSQTKFRG